MFLLCHTVHFITMKRFPIISDNLLQETKGPFFKKKKFGLIDFFGLLAAYTILDFIKGTAVSPH